MTIEFNKDNISLGSEALADILNFDALSVAEKITGEYRTDASNLLGLALNVSVGSMKTNLLESFGDATLRTEMPEYLDIVESLGFTCVLTIPFTVNAICNGEGATEENQYFYWNAEKSILLVTSSSSSVYEGGETHIFVNSAKMYFEADLANDVSPDDFMKLRVGSVSFCCHDQTQRWSRELLKTEYFLQIDIDASQAIRHTFALLEGEIVYRKKWNIRKHPKHLWMCHYGDTSEKNFSQRILFREGSICMADIICAQRVRMLPQDVQDAIGAQQWVELVGWK